MKTQYDGCSRRAAATSACRAAAARARPARRAVSCSVKAPHSRQTLASCAALAGPRSATCCGVSSLSLLRLQLASAFGPARLVHPRDCAVGEEARDSREQQGDEAAHRKDAGDCDRMGALCARSPGSSVAAPRTILPRGRGDAPDRRNADPHGALGAQRRVKPTFMREALQAPDRSKRDEFGRVDRRPRAHSDDQSAGRRLHRVRRYSSANGCRSGGFEVEYVRAEGVRGDSATAIRGPTSSRAPGAGARVRASTSIRTSTSSRRASAGRSTRSPAW